MARVYLETSFVSACVSSRADTASAYRRQLSNEWWDSQRADHELFISAEVIVELSRPEYPHSEAALALVADVPILAISPEVRGLAEILIREKVMPAPIAGDAVHVAVAAVHGVDYLLSWNVRHLANPNKTRHLRTICLRFGISPPLIVTPDYLWETES